MDDVLLRVIERVLEPARVCFAHYAQEERLGIWLQPPKPDIHELQASVVEALQAHPIFSKREGRYFGEKQLQLNPDWIARPLLRTAAARDPAKAVQWLYKVYSTDIADVRLVVEVHGLNVEKSLTLSNGVALLPLRALPASQNANALARQYQWPPAGGFAIHHPPIAAVLELRGTKASNDFEKSYPAMRQQFSSIARSVMAFTLVAPAAPVVGVSWVDFVDPDLATAEFGRMWFNAGFEGVLGRVPPIKVDQNALNWVERYFRIAAELRPSCDLAIDRLNLARRRMSAGDKAIEGGICLEALLGDDDSKELTYKLSLRAALLLGRTLQERQAIKRDVSRFYRLRSKTVHGRSQSIKEAQEDGACADRGLGICADALCKIVEMNEKLEPAVWELLGGPPTSPHAIRGNESST